MARFGLHRRRSRPVVAVDWHQVVDHDALLGGIVPSLLWFGSATDSPVPTDLLFPELANDEVKAHHAMPAPAPIRLGIASLPRAIVSGRSLVGSDSRLYRLGPLVPRYVDNYLGDDLPVGDRSLADKRERRVRGVTVLVTHWNSGVYGHWLVEGLTKVLLLRQVRHRLPDVSILLPRSLPRFVADWIGIVVPEMKIEEYDDAAEYVRADRLLVPSVVFAPETHHFHPDTGTLLTPLLPTGPSPQQQLHLYVSRLEPSHYRNMYNREEIENIAVTEGLQLVRPETMRIVDQIALFARAELVVGEFGSAMHNALFSPPGTSLLCLNWINGLQSRIAELKRQRVGYLLPSSGTPVTYRLGAAAANYHIEPDRFRQCVRVLRDA